MEYPELGNEAQGFNMRIGRKGRLGFFFFVNHSNLDFGLENIEL